MERSVPLFSKGNSSFCFPSLNVLPLFAGLFYKCWVIAYYNAKQGNYIAEWNRLPFVELRNNQESRMVSYFGKFHQGNKWYSVIGYDSWADSFRECYQKRSFREQNIWNETWGMKIIQAENHMQIFFESLLVSASSGTAVRHQIWGKGHETSLQWWWNQILFCREGSKAHSISYHCSY